jgi:thymidylate synthase (FAD)
MSNVELVAITKGVGKLDKISSEEIITYVARVSSPQNQMNFNTSSKLLKYCLDNKHFSIFEHSFMTLEIKTSLSIATQIIRHRSFFVQQFSNRYSTSQKYVKHDARRQDVKNRQNSIDDMTESDKKWFKDAQEKLWEMSSDMYNQALNMGIAKELARMLLPTSTETTLYLTGNVRSWIHYIMVRTDPSTQKEHRDVAEACKKIFAEQHPQIASALNWL